MVLGLTAVGRAAPFPPLNANPTTEHRPGKLVWADLFTSDPAGATKFYSGLLGWTATTIDQKGKAFTIFKNDGNPVGDWPPIRLRSRISLRSGSDISQSRT